MEDIKKLIIYEDDSMYVCHKPAGVLSQADRGFSQDMVSALLLFERKKGNKQPFIAPVNRLDRPVEGLIIFAKSSKAAAELTRQITSGGVDKYYYAVVKRPDIQGELEYNRSVSLTDYLLKDGKNNISKVVEAGTEGAKKAELKYSVLAASDKELLLKVKLYTGRHHQIRVQLANAGMPIAGDTKYNPDNEAAGAKEGKWVNISLCSYRLELIHPVTKKKLEFETVPKSEHFKSFDFFK